MNDDPLNVSEEQKCFKFIQTATSCHLHCPLCQKLMIRPMRIHPCGHTFCSNCITKHEATNNNKIKNKKCPIYDCQRKYQIIQQDRTAESLIDQLRVVCINEGCVWKGDYDTYKKTHKQKCLLKFGLNSWLSQLTKGIIIKAKQSQNRVQNIQNIEPNHQSEKIQKQQNQQNQLDHSNIQSLQKGHEDLQKFEKQKISYQNAGQNQKDCSNKLQEISQHIKQPTPKQIKKQSSQKKRRPQNISTLFNPHLGLNIEDQINESQKKRRYFNKQLKKLSS